MNTYGNLIGDTIQQSRVLYEVISPVTGKVIDHVSLATREEIVQAVSLLPERPRDLPAEEVFGFLKRLKEQILFNKDIFFEKTCLETGFIAKDSMEIVDSSIEFLNDFEIYVHDKTFHKHVIKHSYSLIDISGSAREMHITDRPYRYIAAIVPQNASLTLSITIIASALYAGGRAILRPSLQSASTGALLAEAVMKSYPPESSVMIINSLASDFLDACYSSDNVDLIHYIGSNQYALTVLTQAFTSGKHCLLDGQGNGMLYLDDTFPVDDAVEIITSAATRFNGETCTSVNGVLIKDTIYKSVRDALVESFENLRVGHPFKQDIQVGPLFGERYAINLKKSIRDTGRSVLCGMQVDGAYFTPAIIEGVSIKDSIVSAGFFGPVIWIQDVKEETMWAWLRENSFPLSDTILSTNMNLIRTFTRNSRAARICVNGDPSAESMFEPWGGYPPSGLNPVSLWTEKYRQTFHVDGIQGIFR